MTDSNQNNGFDLHSFFPYQVRIYYRAVSDAVAHIYKSQFDLSVSEWRVMAVLGPNNVLSASDIAQRSSVTKVNVSRAVKSLHESGFLKRDIDGDDRRFAALRLTVRGREVFDTLLPPITQLESDMFAGFDTAEKSALIAMMERVRHNIEGDKQ